MNSKYHSYILCDSATKGKTSLFSLFNWYVKKINSKHINKIIHNTTVFSVNANYIYKEYCSIYSFCALLLVSHSFKILWQKPFFKGELTMVCIVWQTSTKTKNIIPFIYTILVLFCCIKSWAIILTLTTPNTHRINARITQEVSVDQTKSDLRS